MASGRSGPPRNRPSQTGAPVEQGGAGRAAGESGPGRQRRGRQLGAGTQGREKAGLRGALAPRRGHARTRRAALCTRRSRETPGDGMGARGSHRVACKRCRRLRVPPPLSRRAYAAERRTQTAVAISTLLTGCGEAPHGTWSPPHLPGIIAQMAVDDAGPAGHNKAPEELSRLDVSTHDGHACVAVAWSPARVFVHKGGLFRNLHRQLVGLASILCSARHAAHRMWHQ